MTANENRTNPHPCIPSNYRQWVVSRSHSDDLTPSSFEQRVIETPALSEGEALVRVKLLKVHSATRLRMARGIVAQGETDPNSYACAEVVPSRDPAFAAGDLIACQAGWQEYAVIRSGDPSLGFAEPGELVKAANCTNSPWNFVIRPALARQWSVSVLMEVFGKSGITAWFGLRENGPIMPRDTVAVAATTGSVGSIGRKWHAPQAAEWSDSLEARTGADGSWKTLVSTPASTIARPGLTLSYPMHSRKGSTFSQTASAVN